MIGGRGSDGDSITSAQELRGSSWLLWLGSCGMWCLSSSEWVRLSGEVFVARFFFGICSEI